MSQKFTPTLKKSIKSLIPKNLKNFCCLTNFPKKLMKVHSKILYNFPENTKKKIQKILLTLPKKYQR